MKVSVSSAGQVWLFSSIECIKTLDELLTLVQRSQRMSAVAHRDAIEQMSGVLDNGSVRKLGAAITQI